MRRQFTLWMLVLAVADCVVGCGDDDRPTSDGGLAVDAGPARDGGVESDGGADSGTVVPTTCADYAFLASGAPCPATCVSFTCDCPTGFPRSIVSCSADGCLVGADCRAVCGAASLADALDCVSVYTVREPLRVNGASCTEDMQCVSAICSAPVAGTGVCSAGARGDPCSVADDCRSGRCEASLCADWPMRSVHVGGSAGANQVDAVVVDASGKAFIAGVATPTSTMPFDATAARGRVYVARVDVASGDVDWVRTFLPTGATQRARLALAPDGDLILAGEFWGAATLPDGPTTALMRDGYVIRLAPDGTPRWTVHIAGPQDEGVDEIAVSSRNVVMVAGHFEDTISVGALSATSTPGQDGFVLALAADGTPIALDAILGTSTVSVLGLTALPDGNFLTAGGTSTGTVTVGGITTSNAYFVRLGSDGGVLSAFDFDVVPSALRAGAGAGGPEWVVTGRKGRFGDLGGGALGQTLTTGIFVAGFDGTTHAFSTLIGEGEDVEAGRVATRTGQAVASFRFLNDLAPRTNYAGGDLLPMSNRYDFVVAGLDGAGALQRYTVLDPQVSDLAFAPDGSILVVGSYVFDTIVDGVTYTNDADEDSMFLILAPY